MFIQFATQHSIEDFRMASQWYYACGDVEKGPVSAQELKQLADSGQLTGDCQVWKDGMAEWAAASSIPNLIADNQAPSRTPAATPQSNPAPEAGGIGGIAIDTGDAAPAASFSDPGIDALGPQPGEQFGATSRMPGPSRGQSSSGTAQEYLTFKKMITPLMIQIVFWIMFALVVLGGLYRIFKGIDASRGGSGMIIEGIVYLLLGPIVIRIYCEILMIIFSINDRLIDIKRLLERKSND
jgi:hypothetical protein